MLDEAFLRLTVSYDISVPGLMGPGSCRLERIVSFFVGYAAHWNVSIRWNLYRASRCPERKSCAATARPTTREIGSLLCHQVLKGKKWKPFSTYVRT